MKAYGDHGRAPENYVDHDVERQHGHYAQEDDERCAFEVDRSRIIHSAAFRRLSGKTQVFAIGQSDFFRTRLTHSLEVAQIAKGIALKVGVANVCLVEAASLAHDIGHPPFGHKGERVLRERMKRQGGFEANAQNFRVLCNIEVKFPECEGLDLTRGTLDALFKYKEEYSEDLKKFFYRSDRQLVDWLGGPDRPSLECSIMELADDIAYAVHDLEDGLHSGMVSPTRVLTHAEEVVEQGEAEEKESDRFSSDDLTAALDVVSRLEKITLTDRERKAVRKGITSELIGRSIQSCRLVEVDPDAPSVRYRYEAKMDGAERRLISALKKINFTLLVDDPRVQTLESRAERILKELFDHFSRREAEKLYPEDFRESFHNAREDESGRARVASDYISGMTDQYAERLYQRIFTASRAALHDY